MRGLRRSRLWLVIPSFNERRVARESAGVSARAEGKGIELAYLENIPM